jgi:hypothetical protein
MRPGLLERLEAGESDIPFWDDVKPSTQAPLAA